MFEEQVGWAVDAGVDFIIAETYLVGREALIALEVIKQPRLPAVVTLALHRQATLRDGWTPRRPASGSRTPAPTSSGSTASAARRRCCRCCEQIRAAVKCHVAALPVPYRTTEAEPTFQSLRRTRHAHCIPGGRPFPLALDPFTCNRYEIAEFGARGATTLGVRYLGVCCGAGAAPHPQRSPRRSAGTPPASRYSADMSKHAFLGNDARLKQANREYAERL